MLLLGLEACLSWVLRRLRHFRLGGCLQALVNAGVLIAVWLFLDGCQTFLALLVRHHPLCQARQVGRLVVVSVGLNEAFGFELIDDLTRLKNYIVFTYLDGGLLAEARHRRPAVLVNVIVILACRISAQPGVRDRLGQVLLDRECRAHVRG